MYVRTCVRTLAPTPDVSQPAPMNNTFELSLDTDIENLGRVGCALHNHEIFDAYVELRLHGFHSTIAFRQAFIDCDGMARRDADNLFYERVNYVEFNPYVTGKLRDRIAQVKASELWNTNIALHEILALARDPVAKDATRLNAMKELNVLVGITVVDENGKTKAGRSLEDFYRDLANETPEVANTNESHEAIDAPTHSE